MKALLALAALLLVPALPAAAERQEAHWEPAAYFDVLGPGNQHTHLRDATSAVCGPLTANHIGCTGSYSSSASVGGRVGMYYETEDYRWGASLGALTGGPDQGRWSVATVGPNAGATQRTTSTVLRLLGEASQKFLISDDWYGNIGAGLGLSMTNQTTTCVATGFLGAAGGPCYSKGGTVSLGWVAWELFPAIQYQEFELGVRYSGMARGGRHAPWNAFGASLGWHFE